MSIHFGVCTALLYGDVPEEAFKKFEDVEINSLTKGCTVEHLPEYDQDFREGRQPASIEVKLKNGRSVREELKDVPWLDADAVQDRFKVETATMLHSSLSKRLLALIMSGNASKSSELIALFKAS